MEGIDFNKEFQKAFDLMENTKEHVFLTGRAGTGKSTLLTYFRDNSKKNVVVLAPTGIAAINVRGQTIHSFFGFPAHPINSDHIRKRKNKKLFEKIETIVIDEISMVRADVLDAINHFMRLNGSAKHKPFGGVQMILIGDLFQLPPVVSSDVEKQMFTFLYDTPFFFSAHSMHNIDLNYVELKTVYRQKDGHFLALLDEIRTKQLTQDTLYLINQRCRAYANLAENEHYITLTTTNKVATHLNEKKLAELTGKTYYFECEVEGKFQQQYLPNEEVLAFKKGAQVMFVRNDLGKRWVNGTLGKVHHVDEERLTISTTNELGKEELFDVGIETWELLKYEFNEKENKIVTEVMGSFKQYPIKLAWAITIHKSQGKTFDRVVIDIGRGAFAPGQVYVALSRCTTLEGIALKRSIRYKDVIIDHRVVEFAQKEGLY